MQATRLSLRWLDSRRRAFARHPECETFDELNAVLKSEHPECTTPSELQAAIERDNERR
jgi:hypothetical protein